MAQNNRPLIDVQYSIWEDGEDGYGWEGDADPDIDLYLLARKAKEYNLRREEGGPELKHTFYEYEFYHYDNITVDKKRDMESDGWEFVDVSISSITDTIHQAFHAGAPE